jgi:hypothetical protein
LAHVAFEALARMKVKFLDMEVLEVRKEMENLTAFF